MKIIDADKLHYKQVYIQTEKGLRPALVVFAKEIRKMPEIKLPREQTFCAECDHSIKCEDCDIDYHFEHLAPTVDAEPVVFASEYYVEKEFEGEEDET